MRVLLSHFHVGKITCKITGDGSFALGELWGPGFPTGDQIPRTIPKYGRSS